MKKCKECGSLKNKKDFYPTQGECKDCTKLRVKKRQARLRLDPENVEKERKRSREKYHRLNYKDRYKSSKKENRQEHISNYKSKFPEKRKAAILSQHINVPKGFERHHWNYNIIAAKDIIPLSVRDHAQLHRFLDYDEKLYIFKCSVSSESFKKGQLLDTKEKHIKYFIELKTSKLWE